jgi:hypothetical protein
LDLMDAPIPEYFDGKSLVRASFNAGKTNISKSLSI